MIYLYLLCVLLRGDQTYSVLILSVVCCHVIYFFFFKQKTAYEMRISDWSSDVCSSDLVFGAVNPGSFRISAMIMGLTEAGELQVMGSGHRASQGIKIGRASCRERVCQYV